MARGTTPETADAHTRDTCRRILEGFTLPGLLNQEATRERKPLVSNGHFSEVPGLHLIANPKAIFAFLSSLLRVLGKIMSLWIMSRLY